MTRSGLAVFAITALLVAATPAQADNPKNRWIKFNNNSDQAILEVHFSNTQNENWGADLLDTDQVISAHHALKLNLDDGTDRCHMDVKVVMEDGTKRFKYNYNVCAETELNVEN